MAANRGIVTLVSLLSIVVQLLVGPPRPAYAKSSEVLNPARPRYAELAVKAQREGTVRVIVGLNVSSTPEGRLMSERAVQAQRNAIHSTQDILLGSLDRQNVKAYAEWDVIPYMALKVDEAALKVLESSPLVTSIEEDMLVPPALNTSIPLIGADQVRAVGVDGSGWTVAILDTGVQADHEFLGGSENSRVVSEACYSNAGGDGSGMTLCPDGTPSQETGHAADPTTSACMNGGSNLCSHGTHVAGIAAGDGPQLSGVAPGASIVAIQVFTRFDSPSICASTSTPCVLSYNSDRISALQHVYELRDTYNIAAINMSIGGGRSTGYCDSGPEAAIVDVLHSVGIATVIAAGNSGYTDAIAYPACISSAVAVGASNDDNTVAVFSNSSPLVDLLAPGASIRSSIPGNTYGTMLGTSMAAPHVAGAWALLKSVNPTTTVDEVLTALEDTGFSITDARNGVTKSRIDVGEAAGELNQATWLGYTTSWNAADNWSTGAVPSWLSSVIVPAAPSGGYSPVIDVDVDVHNMIITDGAQLGMTTKTLCVYGDWLVQGSGVFSATGGTVVFQGKTSQTISMTTNADDHFHNLQIGNGSSTPSLVLRSDLNVDGNLTLVDGATLEAGSNTLHVAGNWHDIAHSFASSASTVVLDGERQTVNRATVGTVMSQDFSDYDGSTQLTSLPPTGWSRPSGTDGWWFTGDSRDSNWSGIARVFGIANKIDVWLFSSALHLRRDVTYLLQFKYHILSNPQQLYVKLGSSPITAAMTRTIFADADVDNASWIRATQAFTVATDGTYYLGFNDFNPAFASGSYGATLDDVILTGVEDLTFHNLIVDHSSLVMLNHNVRVENDLTVFGTMDVGDNTLDVEEVLAGDGSLQQTRSITAGSTVEFLHFQDVALVTIADNTTDGEPPGETTVIRHNRPPGGGSPDPGEMPFYVEIDATADSDLNTDLTICYTAWEVSQGNGVNEDNLVLFRYADGTWANVGFDVRDTVDNCVTRYHVTDFGIWTLSAQAPLAEYEVAPLGLVFDVQHVNAGAMVSQSVTITNHNSTDLRITSVDLLGNDAEQFAIANDTGETTLTPGSTCTIWISFDPRSIGVKTATLQITTDDDEPTIAVALSGTAVDQDVSVSPLNIVFGSQNVDARTTISQTMIIANDGTADLSITNITLLGNDAGEFSITSDSGEAVLSPGSSRTLWVSFTPSSPGAKNATLQVTTDDGDRPTVEVPLSGTGSIGTGTQRILLPLVANDTN